MREVRIDLTLYLGDEGTLNPDALCLNINGEITSAQLEGEITPNDEEDHAMLVDFGTRLLRQGLETPRMLVLSTSHVTRSTNDNFDMLTDDVPLFYPKNARGDVNESYGWIIPIDPETPWSHMVSADLVAIRAIAEAAGCTWIMLDQDGDTVEGLPTYDW